MLLNARDKSPISSLVATVLILLSVSLITFIQYYFTQETENAIKEDA
ncbi:MAG: hypothetical protein E6758_07190, partial [Staphylococcus epidermidis]|nr:hypothetical protein [Staphylococcus epidermidis]